MYNFPPKAKPTLYFTCDTVDRDIAIEGSNHQAFENISHVCRNIDISYDDRIDYLMQFSFYISLKSDLLLHTSYVSAGIDSDEVALGGYQAAIHYTAMHNVHKFSEFFVILDNYYIKNVRIDLYNSMYFLSISKTLSCPQKFTNTFKINAYVHRILERYYMNIYIDFLFQTPHSYFKWMDNKIIIFTVDFPLCDVLVNFQLVLTKKSNKSQETCNAGFLQVSFL